MDRSAEPRALPRFVAISPPDAAAAGGHPFLRALHRALEGALPGLLLRLPGVEDAAVLDLGRRVVELLDRAESRPWFAVHDRPHLAVALGADAVHLGHRSLPAERVKQSFGLRVGVSLHRGDAAPDPSHADYAFLGPLRPSPSKPEGSPARRPPLCEEEWRRAREDSALALFALGGVRVEDVPRLRSWGLHGVAAISGVFGAPDPAEAAEAYLRALEGRRP
ncbi:MAG TPA: hypothetical protein ENJ09_09755 [Planctomycetes bacterium]|nr:hypothetical protein [Planctomycetota bacterium]